MKTSKSFEKKIEKIFKFDTNAISNNMRYRIVITINSLKIFSNFVCWKKNFFCWKWSFKSLKEVTIFYKMNIMNAFACDSKCNRLITFDIAFFSFSNSWRMINIIGMFNFLIFINSLRLLIVIAMFNSYKNFSKCFRNRRSHRRRDFFNMWQLHN